MKNKVRKVFNVQIKAALRSGGQHDDRRRSYHQRNSRRDSDRYRFQHLLKKQPGQNNYLGTHGPQNSKQFQRENLQNVNDNPNARNTKHFDQHQKKSEMNLCDNNDRLMDTINKRQMMNMINANNAMIQKVMSGYGMS